MAAVRKKAADICPRYHEEPVADRNQIMLPNPTNKPDQMARGLPFLIVQEINIVKVAIPAPRMWARYCCSNLSSNRNLNGIDKRVGIGG